MTILDRQRIGHQSAGDLLSSGQVGEQRSLRVVHVVSSLQVGGMEQFVLRIAAEQQRRGHHVTVMSLHGGPLLSQAEALGLQAMVLEGPKIGRGVRAVASMARCGPEIAHAHNPSSLPYALLAKLSVRARVVMTRHGQQQKRTVGNWQWRSADAVVAVSQSVAASMQAEHPAIAHKISVIPNGVHLTGQQRSREQVRADLGLRDERVGIIVARLDRFKGHDSLFRALGLLREQETPATMLVVGDGPERMSLEGLAHQLGLGPDRLRLLGYRSDISDLLTAADFFVLPSLAEGLPLSVLEAMAHALPVVATPVGGIPEVITHGLNGLLVPVNEPEALSRAIAELIRDPALRQSLGGTALRHVRDRFSFEAMAERYEELYRGLLGKSRA
jgi:glycosyltransferase involved in cell wall biosynthesis